METVGDFEYNPKDLIGHGAFAVVFKGRSKQGGLVVAIKSITKKNLSKSHNLLGKEIKILKELTEVHHENIVALLDCKETSHHVFLVMEYCNGGDLADYLSVKGTLSEDTIRLFLRQLAGAMRALNAKGIVHRDLKPQNILLSYAGKAAPQPHYIVLKIADFGFARFLQDGVMAATLCGSPMYMAPEVIMSLQYDAKADLWSLGTIVFQCLTGRAPFQAQTPQALKQFYERNQNLQPKIPAGTSQELHSLLMGLLRRNAKDRIDFETFFSHPFLQRPPPSPPQPVPRASPPPPPAAQPQPQPVPPKPSKVPIEPTRDADEDFVLVPQVAKSPPVIRQASPPRPSSLRLPQQHDNPPQSEPLPVPSQKSAFKQIQESLAKTETKHNPGGDSQSPASSASSPTSPTKALVPRSQPISVCSHDADKLGPDLSSLSPPAVQFSIGTPPGVYTPGGGRRRSASGSSGGTPPQHPWTISPSVHSPLRKPSVSSPHLPNGSLPPIKGSPTKAPSLMELGDTDSCGSGGSRATPIPHSRSPCTVIMPMHTRAVTLPDFTPYTRSQSHSDAVSSPKPVQPRSLRSTFGSAPYFSFGSNGSLQRRVSGEETAMVWGSSPGVEGPLVFVAPDLPEETLLEKEHNDTLAKLHFVLALVDCIGEVAKCRASPLTAALVDSCSRPSSPAPAAAQPVSEAQRRAEQLTLHLRALQLLSSALSLAWEELKVQRLQPSITVKQTIKELNERFRLCLSTCKALNSPGLFQSVGMDPSNTHVVADKLLYSHAIDMCQSAALDELFGNPGDCFRRYQTAQLLLHSLAHQVQHPTDKGLLNKYKDAVEKRLYVLQQQGYIYAYDTT